MQTVPEICSEVKAQKLQYLSGNSSQEIIVGFPQNSSKFNFPKRNQQTVNWKDREASKGQTLYAHAWGGKAMSKKAHKSFQAIQIPALDIWVHTSPLSRSYIHKHYLKYDFDLPTLGCRSLVQCSRPEQEKDFRDYGQELWKASLDQENPKQLLILQRVPKSTRSENG